MPTALPGVVVLESERATDERGAFTRLFDRAVLDGAGLVADFPQHSRSDNTRRGTVRGLHLQRAPHAEVKLVRCLTGRLWDVVVDVRPDSPAYRQWVGVELAPGPSQALYVPEGFAHGFQTLEDDTSILYLISTPHEPSAADGIRWDDPSIGIAWPLPPTVLSERDRALRLLDP